MNALLFYMLKSALYLTAFYMVYYFLLSRDTSYSRNRMFILLSLLSSMILPAFALQNVRPLSLHVFGKYLSEVLITGSPSGTGSQAAGVMELSPVRIISIVYLAGTALFILKMLADLFNLLFLILKQRNNDSRIIRFHGFRTAGFSAMGYVFINSRLDGEEASQIISHEQNHLKRLHSADIILAETIKAFQWFNPAIWMFDRALRAIHEFQADQECLTSGIPIVSYQCLLLNQVFRTKSFNLTNSFSNPSLIRKRMIMMTRKRTSALASMKLLFVLPVTILIFIFISAFGKTNAPNPVSATTEMTGNPGDSTETEPFVVVDQMPVFPGGDAALLQFLARNTVYPESSKKRNIQGKVVLRFCVTAKGRITRIGILKSVDPALDAEAVRVVKALPEFIPGKQGGKDVPVWYMVPITFTLN